MKPVTHIHHQTAQQAYADLLATLGTDNTPSQWMAFMEAVEQHLPLMAQSGRPSRTDIDGSLIGQLGFTSWKAMIESPVESGGLGWSYNSWKAWLKAWSLVKQRPYLRQEPLTASAMLKLKRDFREFPGSPKALEQAKAERVQQRQQQEDHRIATLKGEIEALSSQIIARDSKIEVLIQSDKIKESEIRKLQQEIAGLKTQLETQTKITRWEHFKRLVVG